MTSDVSPFTGIFSNDDGQTLSSKPDFALVPQRIREDLCRLVGAQQIVSTHKAAGGVSASAAFLIDFDNGDRLFVKGSHPGDQSHGAANLRGECMVYRSVDALRDFSPVFRGMVLMDHGDDNGWWLGAWTALQATSSKHPYDSAAARRLLDDIQHCDVAPSAGLAVASAHPYLSQFLNDAYKWKRLRDDSTRADKFAQCFANATHARQWLNDHVGVLCALQSEASHHAWKLGFMHGDLRCDNLLYGCQGDMPARWWVIDWANAAEGPLAFDRVMLAASLHAQGSLTVKEACAFADDAMNADDIRLMLVQQAGYFADQIYRLPPPAMARLRPVQKAMFWALTRMLAQYSDVPAPSAAIL